MHRTPMNPPLLWKTLTVRALQRTCSAKQGTSGHACTRCSGDSRKLRFILNHFCLLRLGFCAATFSRGWGFARKLVSVWCAVCVVCVECWVCVMCVVCVSASVVCVVCVVCVVSVVSAVCVMLVWCVW